MNESPALQLGGSRFPEPSLPTRPLPTPGSGGRFWGSRAGARMDRRGRCGVLALPYVAIWPSPSPEWQGRLNSDFFLHVCPWGPGREGACPRGLLVISQETGAPVNQQRAFRAACGGQEVESSLVCACAYMCARVCARVWRGCASPGPAPVLAHVCTRSPRRFSPSLRGTLPSLDPQNQKHHGSC